MVTCEYQDESVHSDIAVVKVTGRYLMASARALMEENGDALAEDSPKVVVTDFAG